MKILLTDPNFHVPSEIDGIFGAAILLQIIGWDKIVPLLGHLIALETCAKYAIIGQAECAMT